MIHKTELAEVTVKKRTNSLDFFRLIFAMMVILAHSAELVDGNQHRELYHRFFGNSTFGAFAVDGFFILSGYLITQSWIRTPPTCCIPPQTYSSYLSRFYRRLSVINCCCRLHWIRRSRIPALCQFYFVDQNSCDFAFEVSGKFSRIILSTHQWVVMDYSL